MGGGSTCEDVVKEPLAPATDVELVALRIRYFRELAATRLALRLAPPTFDLGLRGAVAGKADLRRWHLRFNAQLLRQNRDHFLEHTVGHEVAHLVVHALWGPRPKPHGPEWREVMSAFGLPPQVTHRYDVTGLARPRSPFVYRCGCGGETFLGVVRHRRMRRGVRYFCRRCRAELEFVRVER